MHDGGPLEREYRIPTGNTVYGIQNLDYDEESGEFWFSTYGKSAPYQPEETLYRLGPALDGREGEIPLLIALRLRMPRRRAVLRLPAGTASTDAGPARLTSATRPFLKTRYTEQELTALVEGA